MKIRTTQLLSAVAVLALSAGSASAAVITLTAGTQSTPLAGTDIAFTLNDSFAYDPDDPTSVNPDINLNTVDNAYHGDVPAAADAILTYTLSTYTVVAGDEIVLDAWGRSGTGGNRHLRDDDYDVLLTLGGSTVASVLGEGIPTTSERHNRTSFIGLTAGTQFDGVTIVGHESAGRANNAFTLLEVRLASLPVPEPGSLALLGLGGLMVARRRRNG